MYAICKAVWKQLCQMKRRLIFNTNFKREIFILSAVCRKGWSQSYIFFLMSVIQTSTCDTKYHVNEIFSRIKYVEVDNNTISDTILKFEKNRDFSLKRTEIGKKKPRHVKWCENKEKFGVSVLKDHFKRKKISTKLAFQIFEP